MVTKYKLFFENFQLANNKYFQENIIPKNYQKIIIDITNGNNYTKGICDMCFQLLKAKYTEEDNIKNKLINIYNQLKNYDKNFLPIKNLNIFDLTNIDSSIFLIRATIIMNLKKLPSIAIRNLKNDIREERNEFEFSKFSERMIVLKNLLEDVLDKEEHIKNLLLRKIFNSQINTVEKCIAFLNNKKNLLIDDYYNYSSLVSVVENDCDSAEIIYAENKILVIKINNSYDIKLVGRNTLWCFTLNNHKNYDVYATNNIVYVVANFNLEEKNPNHMVVLLQPYDSNDKKEIGWIYDATNYHLGKNFLHNLIGKELCDELFTFTETEY